MGYVCAGRRLPMDAPFELSGVLFPANFLRLATPQEKQGLGITEEPDPAPVDSRFYFVSGDGPAVERPIEQVRAMHIATVKAQAGGIILAKYPQHVQANMSARGVELTFKMASGQSLSTEEQTEAAALQAAFVAIKSIRTHSDTLEAEINGLAFDALKTWQPHDWPAI